MTTATDDNLDHHGTAPVSAAAGPGGAAMLSRDDLIVAVNRLMISAMEDIDCGRNEAGDATQALVLQIEDHDDVLRSALAAAERRAEEAGASRDVAVDRAVCVEQQRNELRGMKQELEILLASERAAREKAERELASVTTDRDSWVEQADQRAAEAVEYLQRATAAEARAARLREALREIADRTGHFGEAPPPPEWMPMLSLIAWVGRTSRAALAGQEVGR